MAKIVRKFHIGRKGPAPCNAKTGACPFGGGSEHFRTRESAEKFEYGAKTQLTKINGVVGRVKPDFDTSQASEHTFKLDKAATLETKNRGEFAELYALQHLLSDNSTYFAKGSESFHVTAVQAKNHQYLIEDNGNRKDIFVKTPNGLVARCDVAKNGQARALRDVLITGSKRKGFRTFSSRVIQEECVRLGFTNGRVPKAPASSKADLRVWDDAEQEHRISIKSFLGRNPGLMSASKASVFSYEASPPSHMNDDECSAIAEKASHASSSRTAYKILHESGVRFDPEAGFPDHPTFHKNLTDIDPQATSAYGKALFTMVDPNLKNTDPNVSQAYRKILGNFAHGMTYTQNPPKSEHVTDFMTIKSDGSVVMQNFPSVDETGSDLASRVEFVEPSKGRAFGGGSVEYVDGVFVFKLNANVEIFETSDKRDRKIRNTNRGRIPR